MGIPAGTYELAFAWRDEQGHMTRAGSARVVFYAPSRDPGTTGLAASGIATDVSSDSIEASETFIAAMPGNANRIAVGSNWQDASMPAWITDDGG